jgi:predicted MPP superfamily phosphohydrolase
LVTAVRKELRISVISDIHLGGRKNTAEMIIANLNKHFSCESHFSKIDLVVLAGDVFDEALTLASEHVAHIDAWVARVLRLCHKYSVVIRVLEGTPSHDRGQSERFAIINDIHDKHGLGVDLKYVKTLSIEYMDMFDINVLYVPDEWNHCTDKTLEEVKELMAIKGLQQVDFAIMHGNFHYQLPAHIKGIPRHSEEEYTALVKYLIFIGHIHLHSRLGKIVAQGSFDRLAHGEEGPKGFVSATIQPNGDHTLTFIENVGARKYITVKCRHTEVEDTIRSLDRAVKKLPAGSCVRIEADYLNPILGSVETMKLRWPLLVWSVLPKGKQDKEEDTPATSEEYVYVPVNVRRDNISELMLNRLSKLDITAQTIALCMENLKEIERL